MGNRGAPESPRRGGEVAGGVRWSLSAYRHSLGRVLQTPVVRGMISRSVCWGKRGQRPRCKVGASQWVEKYRPGLKGPRAQGFILALLLCSMKPRC